MAKKQLLTRIFCEDINKLFFACGILSMIIIKFFLIRNSEVVGHPRDSLLYTLMADQNIWFPTNKAKAIIDYMPGYPIFIMFSNFLNFSLRISHEIFYTISNILLVFSFRLLKIPRYICLVIFAILTFHITTFLWFNTILTETIAISLYHILLALTVITVMSENLASYLVVFVILVLRNRMNIARAIREALPICIIPIAISLLITTVFTLLNAFFLELPALSISNSSAFKETFSQIQSIDDGQNIDDFEFVNINRQQLKMAYQVSPTLNQVKPLIEEELARRITRLGGKDTTNIEVAIDWVYWSTIEAIRRSNLTEDRSMYQVFTQINSELQEAFNDKRINQKTFSFDDIDIGFWLNKFPHSLTEMSGYLFLPRVSSKKLLQNTDDPRVTPEMRSIFNRVAHRRTYLVNQPDLNKDLIFYLNRITPLIQIINILGMISFVILLVYYLVKPVHSQLLNQYTLIISFALSIILLRLFLYIAIDLAFFPAPSRYLFPSNPLLSALSILNLYVTTKLLRSFRF
ncbi:MAG: hypothetical protein EWV89_09135 [Microcystis wesenbergii Mw_QC_B_20070930_S4]|nr:MAG: hypothetical protein EWV89_09135 [Microcystis wesenbergii Mw_QC_B_20070930_S4]